MSEHRRTSVIETILYCISSIVVFGFGKRVIVNKLSPRKEPSDVNPGPAVKCAAVGHSKAYTLPGQSIIKLPDGDRAIKRHVCASCGSIYVTHVELPTEEAVALFRQSQERTLLEAGDPSVSFAPECQ
jgi:hypothetical protein